MALYKTKRMTKSYIKTNKMKRLLYILLIALLPMVVYANGDPTAEFCALTLSKAPVPRAIPEIQIERETRFCRRRGSCLRKYRQYG